MTAVAWAKRTGEAKDALGRPLMVGFAVAYIVGGVPRPIVVRRKITKIINQARVEIIPEDTSPFPPRQVHGEELLRL